MAQKITIDRDLCMGCGSCEGTAPDHFELDDEGKAKVKKQYDEADKDIIQEAIDGCPVQAIELVEE